MTHTKTTFTILLAITGCSYTPPDPCQPGILHDHLSEQQLDWCDECGNAAGCVEGSTGDDDPEQGTLSCYESTPDENLGVQNPEFCRVGWEIWPSTYSREAGTCTLRHPGFPCDGNWNGDFDEECVLCEPMKFLNNPQPFGSAVADSNDGWHMCGSVPYFSPATYISPGSVGSDWVTKIQCLYNAIVEDPCEHGFVAIGSGNPASQVFTCRCPDGLDSSCQDGAYCEQGNIIDELGHVRPTLCTWDDGTPNGIAPEGPEVYGIDSWEDGIDVDGDRITVTPQFFTVASRGAVFNDDQGFGPVGDLTHVGADSLAAHLGLSVGDMLDVEQRDVDLLALGETVAIDIIHADGSERVLSVSLER